MRRIDEKWFQDQQDKQDKQKESKAYQQTKNIWDNDLAIAVAQSQQDLGNALNEIIDDETTQIILKSLRKLWFADRQPPEKCGVQQIEGFAYIDDKDDKLD